MRRPLIIDKSGDTCGNYLRPALPDDPCSRKRGVIVRNAPLYGHHLFEPHPVQSVPIVQNQKLEQRKEQRLRLQRTGTCASSILPFASGKSATRKEVPAPVKFGSGTLRSKRRSGTKRQCCGVRWYAYSPLASRTCTPNAQPSTTVSRFPPPRRSRCLGCVNSVGLRR